MTYLDYCVNKSCTIIDAMKTLNSLDPQIVFITEGKKLLSSLTDGDVRRYLIKGGNVNDLAINAANNNPKYSNCISDAVSLYHQKNYIAIPIVDNNRQIIDIYFGKEQLNINYQKLNIPVVINAGGKGTRLEPYTKILPKPLIPVGELPIIEHIMQRYLMYGCEQFHIIVNYKKELLKAFFCDIEKRYDIKWFEEEKPLGTGGGLCLLRKAITDTFFFINCDNLLLSDYEKIIINHKKSNNLITIICAQKSYKIPYGVIELDTKGSFVTIKEKPEFSFCTNTGIYVCEPEIFNYIDDGVSIGFPEIIEKVIKDGNKVSTFVVDETEWLDMGQINELNEMRMKLYGE